VAVAVAEFVPAARQERCAQPIPTIYREARGGKRSRSLLYV